MTRPYMFAVAAALTIGLIAGSPPRLVGDGREYLAQAIEFASFRGPAFRPPDIPHIQAELARFDPSLANWDIWSSTVPDRNRGRVFLHFWFYALLAAPGVMLASALGAPPTLGFTALNVVLLGTALWIALPRIGAAGCLLLFAGPIVWWIDKAHTEAFTFALLTIALATMKDQPGWSMLAAGLASTQNPPIAVLIPIVFSVGVTRSRFGFGDRRVIAAAVAAIVLALLHPVYTYTHHGTPSLLLIQTRPGAPTFQTVSAPILDPSIGLVGNFPLFLIVVMAGFGFRVRHNRENSILEELVIPATAAVIFLLSFSRTTNVHHGGTPSISRYALWLIPLAVPLLAALHRSRGTAWVRFLWCAALTSAVTSVFAFRPSVPQNSREPTWLASFLWTRHPGWNNPLPEVFVETQLHIDDMRVPVATGGCEKILVAGANADAGIWPTPCYPTPVPVECQTPGALCYANFVDRQYTFVPVRGISISPSALRHDAVWPIAAVSHVQRLYESRNWPAMRSEPLTVLRGADNVSVESLGSNARFILVLRNPKEGAVLRLRPDRRLDGVLVDAMTGQTVRSFHYDGESRLISLDLPHDSSILLLAMRTDSSR